MPLLSFEFAYLFIAFLVVYWLFQNNPRTQNLLILLGSYAMVCTFDWRFALLMLGYGTVVYFMGKWLYGEKVRRMHLKLAILVALLPLLLFKYYEFLRGYFEKMLIFMGLDSFLPVLALLLPVGLSFYTFNAITYLVACYRRNMRPASYLEIITYLAFLPILTAGPITRSYDFIPQLRVKRRNIANFEMIMVLIVSALIKKVWLSSYLGEFFVGPIFNDPNQYNSIELVGALYGYAFQLYFDFSGYSDLVIAMALLLGFNIPENFNNPYFSRNLKEFWGRWHISLSTWIKDYIYIPLGGNRSGFARTQINMVLAMVISGIWHAAGVNFIVWGFIHGMGVVIVNSWAKLTGKAKLPKTLAIFITFNYVSFAWLFFNSRSWADAMSYLQAMGGNLTSVPITTPVLGFLVLLVAAYFMRPVWEGFHQGFERLLKGRSVYVQGAVLTLCVFVIILLSPSGIPNFIYANF